jgi:hypothetical protein
MPRPTYSGVAPVIARRQLARLLSAAIAASLCSIATSAQDVTGPSLKAAYIYRFVLFTDWPASVLPSGAPITICVVGDNALKVALERTVKDVSVAGRAVAVTFGSPDRLPRPCHVMYVSAVSRAQTAAALTPYQGQPVLTMSDVEGFNGLGGIAELFYEDGALRFSIRLDEVKRSGIELSSRLLSLSRKR